MSGEISRQLLGVERAAGHDELVDRLARRYAQCEPNVTKLEVEIDKRDPVAGLSERNAEVARNERLPCATLRPEHGDHSAIAGSRRRGGAIAARHRLLQRADQIGRHPLTLGRRGRLTILEGDRHDVLGARREGPTDKAVRGVPGDQDDGTIGILARHAVDEGQRVLAVARAGDDHGIHWLTA